jgi:hypothetical protein
VHRHVAENTVNHKLVQGRHREDSRRGQCSDVNNEILSGQRTGKESVSNEEINETIIVPNNDKRYIWFQKLDPEWMKYFSRWF